MRKRSETRPMDTMIGTYWPRPTQAWSCAGHPAMSHDDLAETVSA